MKYLRSSLAVLLIPCLVGSPSWAIPLSSSSVIYIDKSFQSNSFEEQAFQPYLTWAQIKMVKHPRLAFSVRLVGVALAAGFLGYQKAGWKGALGAATVFLFTAFGNLPSRDADELIALTWESWMKQYMVSEDDRYFVSGVILRLFYRTRHNVLRLQAHERRKLMLAA